jgi:hypothetical protein
MIGVYQGGTKYREYICDIIGWEITAEPGEAVFGTTILSDSEWKECDGSDLPQLFGKLTQRVATWDNLPHAVLTKKIVLGARIAGTFPNNVVETYHSYVRCGFNDVSEIKSFLQGSPFRDILPQ